MGEALINSSSDFKQQHYEALKSYFWTVSINSAVLGFNLFGIFYSSHINNTKYILVFLCSMVANLTILYLVHKANKKLTAIMNDPILNKLDD